MQTLRPPRFMTGARSSTVDMGLALAVVCALGMILSVLEPDAIDRFLVTLTLVWALGGIAVGALTASFAADILWPKSRSTRGDWK